MFNLWVRRVEIIFYLRFIRFYFLLRECGLFRPRDFTLAKFGQSYVFTWLKFILNLWFLLILDRIVQ